MISVIVSSVNDVLFELFRKNLNETIGVAYELIRIENKGQMGICAAYNLGARKAQYPYLVFAHEDIRLHTNDWGKRLLALFGRHEHIGLAGAVGSEYKPAVYSGWLYPGAKHFMQGYMIQSDKGKNPVRFTGDFKSDDTIAWKQVACVDGFFMATKKSVFLQHPFDEQLLQKFHGYDVDFSLQVNQTHQVVVSNVVLVEHLSHGQLSFEWIDEIIKLHQKWQSQLPFFTGNKPAKKLVAATEREAYAFLLNRAVGSRKHLLQALSIHFKWWFIQLLNPAMVLANLFNSVYLLLQYKQGRLKKM